MASQYGQQQRFDMASLAGALPQAAPQYGSPDLSQGFPSPNPYQAQHMQFQQQRGPQFMDAAAMARAQQQQQYLGQQFMTGQGPMLNMARQQGFPMPQQVQYSSIDPYGYGMNPAPYPSIDPRFAQQYSPMMPGMGGMPGMPADMGTSQTELTNLTLLISRIAQYARRASVDTAPIPNFPRGPPRKPKQSGHALWVGNLPPAAQVTELKDHFSRDATSDIESVFLIAKSNCAFVNYRSEAACVAAMNRFHDSRFHGVRLVCRLRRGVNAPAGNAINESISSSPAAGLSSPTTPDEVSPAHGVITNEEQPKKDSLEPTIARSHSEQSADPPLTATGEKSTDRYFIVKSLTAQDLEASVRNGTWATQSHNEDALNKAFEQAENVFLIFSANKSGEYFGYARMVSAISGEPVKMSSAPAAEEAPSDSGVSPQSIPTLATATAPKGRIIDDSARGTIFWEADHSEEDEDSLDQENSRGGQDWGRQFEIEWVSTNRLPFYRTRGLRNPLNANREVKIARDGTELEAGIGRRLVQMFHRPAPSPQGGGASMPMPYR